MLILIASKIDQKWKKIVIFRIWWIVFLTSDKKLLQFSVHWKTLETVGLYFFHYLTCKLNNYYEITNCFSFLADPFVLFSVFPSIFQRLENSLLQVESCLLFWDQVFQLVSKKDKKHKNCKNHTLQWQIITGQYKLDHMEFSSGNEKKETQTVLGFTSKR
jgi:hypothetical protein